MLFYAILYPLILFSLSSWFIPFYRYILMYWLYWIVSLSQLSFYLSSQSFEESAYRGIIIPSFYGDLDESILALDLPFTSAVSTTLYFNCFISYASEIYESNPCSIYPHEISFSASFNTPSTVFDYSSSSYVYISPYSLQAYMIGSNCASSQHFYSIIHSCYCRAISSFFHTISKWFWVWLECSLDSLWWDLHTLCMETMLTSSSLFKSIKFTLNSVHSTFDASIDELQFMIWNKDDAIATLFHTIHTIFRLGLDSSLWYIHHLWIQQFWGYGECGSLKLHLSPISSLQRGILCFCHCSQNHR